MLKACRLQVTYELLFSMYSSFLKNIRQRTIYNLLNTFKSFFTGVYFYAMINGPLDLVQSQRVAISNIPQVQRRISYTNKLFLALWYLPRVTWSRARIQYQHDLAVYTSMASFRRQQITNCSLSYSARLWHTFNTEVLTKLWKYHTILSVLRLV